MDPRSLPRWLCRPGGWYWLLLCLGLGGRLFLAYTTRGTTDAELWTEHASGVLRDGLIGHYERDPLFNHPPFMAWVMARLSGLAASWGVEFRVLYRCVFGLLDMVNAGLLVRVLAGYEWRFLASGVYAITPVAMVLSSMHGNTDSLVSTTLLLTCLAAGKRRRNSPLWTGVFIGLGAWIKIPALFAAPAFAFSFPRWRDRLGCTAVAIAVAVSTYAPAFMAKPALLWDRIFGYRGLIIYTASDPPTWIWGWQIWITRIYGGRIADWPTAYLWFREHSFWIALPLAVLFGYLRRRRCDTRSLAVTVAGTYAIFYAFTEPWTFQYFAWSMPFWLVAGWRFALAANVFGGGYIYVVYAYLCQGDWLLRPTWSLTAVTRWSTAAILFRDLAHAAFTAFALVFLWQAWTQAAGEWQAGRVAAATASVAPPRLAPRKVRRKSR